MSAPTWTPYYFDSSRKGLRVLQFLPLSGYPTDQLAARIASAQRGSLGIESGFLLAGLYPGVAGSSYDISAQIPLTSCSIVQLSSINDGGIERINQVISTFGSYFIEIPLCGLGGESLEMPGGESESNIHTAIVPAYVSNSRGDEILKGYYTVYMLENPKIYVPATAQTRPRYFGVFLKACQRQSALATYASSLTVKIGVAEYDPTEGDWSSLEEDETKAISPWYTDFSLVRIGTVIVSASNVSGQTSSSGSILGLDAHLKPYFAFLEEETLSSLNVKISYALRDERQEIVQSLLEELDLAIRSLSNAIALFELLLGLGSREETTT